MGCICCSEKPIVLEPLKEDSLLFKAQQMVTTETGKAITQKANLPMSDANAKKLLNDRTLPQDFKTVFSPPFNAVSKLRDYLFLTGIGGLTQENLDKLQINLIFNATYEWPNVKWKNITTIRVPVEDGVRDNIGVYFDEVADKIEECRAKGGRVLVHCMAGASRSSTLVLGMSLNQCFKTLTHTFVQLLS